MAQSRNKGQGRGFFNRGPEDEKKHKEAGRLGGLKRAENMRSRRSGDRS